MPFLIVANPESGRPGDDLPAAAAERLGDARILRLGSVDLAAAVGEAVEQGRVVVASGGDGTVNSVVQELVGTNGVLGVLPAGTLNHFARDLGVAEPEAAIEALTAGRPRRVDVGRVGDRVFVNTLALGVYPELVRERERREHRLGKWLALGASIASVLARFRPLEGTITADGDRRALEASIVLVGNNRFSTAPGSIGRRPRLDEGVLEVRVVPARTGMRSRSRLALSLARARPFPRRTINRTARRVEIALAGGPRRVAYDGEQDDEAELVVATVEPRALRVLAPPRFDEPPD